MEVEEATHKEVPSNAFPSPSITKCSHGLPEDDKSLEYRKKLVSEYMTRLHQMYEELAEKDCPESMLLEEGIRLYTVYWKLHADVVDELLVKAVYASAADALVNDISADTRTLTHLGITFEGVVYGRKDKQARDMKKTITDRGIKIFLASKLSCECLSRLKKDAKRAPKMNLCFYCQKEFDRDSIKKCSACMVARYCSRDCQKADWAATHKEQCANFYQLNHTKCGRQLK